MSTSRGIVFRPVRPEGKIFTIGSGWQLVRIQPEIGHHSVPARLLLARNHE